MIRTNMMLGWILIIIALIFAISTHFNIGLETIGPSVKMMFAGTFALISYLFIQIDNLKEEIKNGI